MHQWKISYQYDLWYVLEKTHSCLKWLKSLSKKTDGRDKI